MNKMSEETEKLTMKLPIKLVDALRWYVPLTGFYAGEPSKDEALDAMVAAALRKWLTHERDEPLMATEHVRQELTAFLEA